jgi:hypothetical protein
VSLTQAVIGEIVLICILLLGAQYLLRYVYSYRVSRDGIDVMLFHRIRVIRIGTDGIVEARAMSASELLPWQSSDAWSVWRLGNRIWGDGVLIRRSGRLFKAVFLTPDDPEAFLRELRPQLRLRTARES